jgi:hypothetical protein
MERVAEVVEKLGLSEQRLERLKTAVAEATMNAMEHGNRYRPQAPVVIELTRVVGLRGVGLEISERVPIEVEPNSYDKAREAELRLREVLGGPAHL